MNSTVVIGRTLLSSLFVITAIKGLFFDFNSFVGAVESKNLPLPVLTAIIALLMKLVGGLLVMFNLYPMYGASILIIFTLLATALFHNIFQDVGELTNFLKNLSIVGGLILFMNI